MMGTLWMEMAVVLIVLFNRVILVMVKLAHHRNVKKRLPQQSAGTQSMKVWGSNATMATKLDAKTAEFNQDIPVLRYLEPLPCAK